MPYLVLAFVSLLWGTSFLLIKIATQGFDWTSYSLGRCGLAAAALVLAVSAMRLKWPRSPRVWGLMAAMAIVGQAGPFLLLGVAARFTTSADMALMMGGVPIFTFILARLFAGGEAWSARAALGLAIGLAGVAISLGSPLSTAEVATAPHPALGRALSLIAAVSYAFNAFASGAATRKVGAAMAAAGSMSISTALLVPLTLAVGGPPSLAAAGPAPLAAVVVLGFVNTALAYFVYFRLIASAGATFATLNNYIVPCVGVIAGAWALGEPVGLSSWLGLGGVLVGVALTGSATRPRRAVAVAARSRAAAAAPSRAPR